MAKMIWGGLFFLIYSQAIGQISEKEYSKRIRKFRKEYKLEFKEQPSSPIKKKNLRYLDFYSPDMDYQVTCQFIRSEREEPFEMATYAGTTQPYVKYGVLHFDLFGQSYELMIYQNLRLMRLPQYKDYLFIPFKDLTNGESTYGGGRYLDISRKDILNDSLTLDFNLSYNPYCAYSDGYQCPIPPKENHMEVAIEAGEKEYRMQK